MDSKELQLFLQFLSYLRRCRIMISQVCMMVENWLHLAYWKKIFQQILVVLDDYFLFYWVSHFRLEIQNII